MVKSFMAIDPSCKSHNVSDKYHTVYHFVAEMYTHDALPGVWLLIHDGVKVKQY